MIVKSGSKLHFFRKTTYVDIFSLVQPHSMSEYFDIYVTRVRHVFVAMAMLALGEHPEVGEGGVVLLRTGQVVATHALVVQRQTVESAVVRVSGHVANRHL